MKGPAAFAEECRGFGLGVRPIVSLGNCALKTLRSPWGFQETWFCLLSPESLCVEGPRGNGGRRGWVYLWESQFRW